MENVINNVLEYKELLDKYGKKEQDIVVQFVEMDINKGQTNEFVEFWNKHGIKCKVRPMGSWMGEITAPNQIKGLKRLPCYWGMNTFNIIDTGDVPMCTSDVDCTVNMGNVLEKSIEEIWNTSLKEFRDFHRNYEWDNLPENCAKCMDWQSCYAEYK